MAGTFVIAQGGGPTAVINQTMVGRGARSPQAAIPAPGCSARAMACAASATATMSNLSDVPEAELLRIAGTPSAALGSTRDKPDAAYCEVVLKGLKKVGTEAFIYIGGNDTSGTQQILTDAVGRLDRLRPCAEDHRQRSGGERPHAGLHLGRRISSPAPSSPSISISARCPASMWRSSWAGTPAS